MIIFLHTLSLVICNNCDPQSARTMFPTYKRPIRASRLPSTVIFIIIITLTWSTGHGLRIAKPHYHQPPPKIWFSEYLEEGSFYGTEAKEEFQTLDSFRSEVMFKNGTDYVIEEGLRLIIFACQAKYPIMWTVPEMRELAGFPHDRIVSVPARISEFSPEMEQPSNKYFKSFLVITFVRARFLSANFACRAVDSNGEEGMPQSNLYIYNSGSNQALEHEGDTLSISLDTNGALILPCRPYIPDIPVALQKQIDGSWTPVSSPYLSFDPKIGFTLTFKTHYSSKKSVGSYRCVVNGSDMGRDDDGILFLNVTSGTSTTTPPAPNEDPHLWIAKGKNASVTHKERSIEVRCCFGQSASSGIPNDLHYGACFDQFQCNILKNSLLAPNITGRGLVRMPVPNTTHCSTVRMYSGSAMVRCHGENLDYLGGFHTIFLPGVAFVDNRTANSGGNISSLSRRRVHIDRPLTMFQDDGKMSEVPLQSRILILIGHPFTTNDKEAFLGSVFTGRDVSKFDLIVNKIDREEHKTLKILEYSRNFYFDGEPLNIMCFGLKYYYAEGPKLRLNFRNGSRTILERDPNQGYKYVGFHGGARLGRRRDGVLNTFSREIIANLQMKSVDCLMPAWNSTDWEKLTYNLSVRPSTTAKFVGGDETEIVYFYLNDTNKEITWKIVGGEPTPEITVNKDGKLLAPEDYQLNLNSSDAKVIVQLMFNLTTFDQHGRYECTAENVKGRVVKTISVIIQGKRNVWIPVSITCLVVASAVLLITTLVKFRVQLRQMWKLKRFY